MRGARIAHLIATNFYGGPEHQIVSNAKQIRSMGYLPLIISFEEMDRNNELLSVAVKEGVEVAMLPVRSPFHPGTIFDLTRLLRSKKVNLLVKHGYKANIIGRLATWLGNIPEITVARGWTGENNRIKLYEKLDRLFLCFADQVVAVSERQSEKVKACGVRDDKVCVIHNAIAPDSYPGPAAESIRQELGVPDDAIFIVSAGRLSPEKNHLGLIKAAKLVVEKNSKVRFAVFGEGFFRPQLEAALDDAGLEDRFFFPGFRSDVRSLFYEADIFVLPSYTEGLPNVLLEPFLCKKPVVAAAVGGTPEVVRHNINGLLTPPDDVTSLAEALLLLISSHEMRREMGQNGFEHVLTHFDFEKQTSKYLELYTKLMDRPEKRSHAEGL